MNDDWHDSIDRVRFRLEEVETVHRNTNTAADPDDELLVSYGDLKNVIQFAQTAFRIRTFVLAARAMFPLLQRGDTRDYFIAIRALYRSKRR